MGGPDEVLFTAITPRYSTVLEDRPLFEWTPANDAKKYKVKLYDDYGNFIWETETAETKVKYPDDRPGLKPGKYQWEVIVQVGDRSPEGAPFIMAGEKERRTISASLEHAQRLISDENTINIIYIGALLKSKLYPQAEKELKRALTRTPNDQGLWALLMETYQKMKRWEDREKARLLKANMNDRSALKQFLRASCKINFSESDVR
jgi:tetratricopeptide (TPR) repeat protein